MNTEGVISAIVPMRHNSERVKGKNYRSFGGLPLFHRIIRTLLECEMINEVVIDTDSQVIIEDAHHTFPMVKIMNRPDHLRAGDTPMNAVLINTIKSLKADIFLQTHSTNPLLKKDTIDNAIRFFLDNMEEHDSLFGVTRIHTRLYNQDGKAINHDPSVLLRTQDLPPVFEENSCLYLFSKEIIESNGNRIGKKPIMWEIPREEAIDIDEELDFKFAEFVFSNNNQ